MDKKMNKEFFVALDLLEKEKGIPKEYMIEKIEAALLSACKKEYGSSTLVRVSIDPVIFRRRSLRRSPILSARYLLRTQRLSAAEILLVSSLRPR